MEEIKREEIIRSYVQAYNAFDVEGMMKDLDPNIRFENVSDGVVNMTLNGLEDFRTQALRAAEMFSEREQTIGSFEHGDDVTQISIRFRGMLAENLPGGLQRGDEINLQGTSVFHFADDKIISIADIG